MLEIPSSVQTKLRSLRKPIGYVRFQKVCAVRASRAVAWLLRSIFDLSPLATLPEDLGPKAPVARSSLKLFPSSQPQPRLQRPPGRCAFSPHERSGETVAGPRGS